MTMNSCAYCGHHEASVTKSSAITTTTSGTNNKNKKLQRCSRCKSVYYCSLTCQKRDYARHKAICRSSGDGGTNMQQQLRLNANGMPEAQSQTIAASSENQQSSNHDYDSSNIGNCGNGDDQRFHPSFISGGGNNNDSKPSIREVSGELSREELFGLFMAGECFVWRDSGLIKSAGDSSKNDNGKDSSGKWTFDYLEKHLPRNEKYGGMIADNDERIFRFHKNNSTNNDGKGVTEDDDDDDGGKEKSKRSSFTFREFRSNPNAYMQMPLLWRNSIHCNGFKGPIGDVLWNDLRTHHLLNFTLLSQLRMEPTVFSPFRVLQLFVSHANHLSYLHFDEQPNLFCQISGRKWWLLFPPDVGLRPYGPQSHRARRSSVDVFAKMEDASLCGKGYDVMLNPGDALYVPSYWWHHVHSMTDECISIAIWFFNERLPLSLKAEEVNNNDDSRHYPIPLKLTKEQLLAQRRYQNSSIV